MEWVFHWGEPGGLIRALPALLATALLCSKLGVQHISPDRSGHWDKAWHVACVRTQAIGKLFAFFFLLFFFVERL